MKPVVHLYALCWNEEKIIPYFMSHYVDFVDNFFIYDNESTDSSIELLQKYRNVEIITYKSDNKIRDDIYLNIKNNEWKKSRGFADFVIVCDMDEFLYHENIIEYLINMKNNNFSISNITGYDMISEKFDFNYNHKLTSLLKTGIPSIWFNKLCIFNPNKIDEINYLPGAHIASPTGNVIFNDETLKLLHYKNLSLEYAKNKLNMYKNRLSDLNIKNQWGIQYQNDFDYNYFYDTLSKSYNVI